MRLLYHLPYTDGGMADYASQQLPALAKAGAEVTLLCSTRREGPWWRVPATGLPYTLCPRLRGVHRRALPALLRKPLYALDLVHDGRTLAAEVARGGYTHVLFGAFYEYMAPLWAAPLRRLAARGVVFGSVVHDPVRDTVVGPAWWHRRSVAAGYSFVREAFVHAPITLDTGRPMPGLRTTVVPQGVYSFPAATTPRAEVRRALGLPAQAPAILSFGHIRDGKNLDLLLRALPRFPDLHLLVAGKEQSDGQKPAGYYQGLARKLGVESRCRWRIGFVAEAEAADLINACDLMALIYSAKFRSASAVLNVAAAYRKPCIASGGESNLRDAVRRYDLGPWVEPDNLESLCTGLESWLNVPPRPPRWEDYLAENSWEQNARIIYERLADHRSFPR